MLSGTSSDVVIPKLIVINSRDAVVEFTSTICLPKRDLEELIHQCFDKFMDSGFIDKNTINPILSLLICNSKPVHWTKEKITRSFQKLCSDLRELLIHMNFDALIAKDNGTFNYTFHSLRDNCIVLIHRKPLPDPINHALQSSD
jgi:hypothetical protein